MSTAPTTATQSSASRRRELGSGGLVRVFEYQCPAERGAKVEPEQFTACAVTVVRAGTFGFRSEAGTQLLTTGSWLLANPGQQYEISHEHAGRDRCVIFRIDEAAIEELVGTAPRGAARRYFGRSVLPPTPRLQALRHLAEEQLAAGGEPLGLEEVALTIASVVGRELERAPRLQVLRDRRADRDRVYAAIAEIEAHFDEPLRLGSLAALAGTSAYHFLRMFKRHTGLTPHQYLLRHRIGRAVELLRETRRPVTEVALDVGFGDLSNFIHTFGRELGCSPSKFRAEGRGLAARVGGPRG